MDISQIVPGCVHVKYNDSSAIFGAPSDILKRIISLEKQVPSTVVLPDISFVEGVSQVALEFLLYWHLFHNTGNFKGVFRVIGTKDMCERVKESLVVTLFGPSKEQFKRWRVSKSRTEKLIKIMEYIAIRKDGIKMTLDDIVEFYYYEDFNNMEVPLFKENDCYVKPLGDNIFNVKSLICNERIDLNFEGKQLDIHVVTSESPEIPQILRVRLLGTYSGFDTAGPTTGMFMWINSNGFLVDGPVGTSLYLRQMGIPKSDIAGMILSHVHDDHCTLMDMIISEQVANIITTREIYESMLIKTANVLGESIKNIKNYLKFTEVIPGKSVKMFGAKWEFFYTVHSIPTIGFRVTVKSPDGKDYTVVHSSDTGDFSMLDAMTASGAITKNHNKLMKSLIRGSEALVTIDGGGSPIHGNPSDFKDDIDKAKDVDVLFYHVNPDNVDTSLYKVATPGWAKTYIESASLPQALVLKLLKALNLLDVTDSAWINIIFSKGTMVYTAPKEEIVSKGAKGDDFFFILTGSVEILSSSDSGSQKQIAILESGDFFGEMSIIKGDSRNATVSALSACALFKLPGDIFMDFVDANDLRERFERLWVSRAFISKVKIFKKLHPYARHEISFLADSVTFKKGEIVLRQGGRSDDFYVITKGSAMVIKKSNKNKTVQELVAGDFFGENVAMGYSAKRNASVEATDSGLETLRIKGADLRRIAEKFPVMVHELHIIMRKRGVHL